MWNNRTGEHTEFQSKEEETSIYENSNEPDNENLSLPGSYTGSFTGVEFDVEAGPVSDRTSEADPEVGTPIDWVVQALNIRDRLLSEAKLSLVNNDVANQDAQPRTPSPDYENLHNVEPLPTPDSIPKRGILKRNAETYEMEKYKRNAMIIFNHKDFLSGSNKTREGTMQDEEALKVTFEKFGFEVDTHLNLPKKNLLQELKTFCSKDFTEYGCVCAAILTHGSKHGYLRAYDTRYSEHEIIECFSVLRNPTLLGKPVIILIQACRGDEPATAVNPGTPKLEEDVEMDNDDHYNLPTESDMLIFHSSYIGRASAREPIKGSWFIQTLCKQIMMFAAFEDFESICRGVKKEIALDKECNMFFHNKPMIAKQMPVVTSTLMRLLYLRSYGYVADDEIGPVEMSADEMLICEDDLSLDIVTKSSCCDSYFEYMKKCLRLFIQENPDDEVAFSILKIAGRVKVVDDTKYYVHAELVNVIRMYLSMHADKFKYSEAVYLGKPCCCRNAKARRRNKLCCSVC